MARVTATFNLSAAASTDVSLYIEDKALHNLRRKISYKKYYSFEKYHLLGYDAV
jgi:hypothetical protein